MCVCKSSDSIILIKCFGYGCYEFYIGNESVVILVEVVMLDMGSCVCVMCRGWKNFYVVC